MCIIIYTPSGNIPRKQVKRSLAKNPDGWGIMVATGETVWVRKGMDRKAFWHTWDNRPDGPTVFHARIASHGHITAAQCHPFPVTNHGDLHVAHNGIITPHAKKGTVHSDTQLFIHHILADLPPGFLENAAITRLLEDYIGWSKLVFLDGEGNVHILNERLGHWSKDRWYSNDSYKPVKVVKAKAWIISGSTDPTKDGDKKAVPRGLFPVETGRKPPEVVPLMTTIDWKKQLYGYHVT